MSAVALLSSPGAGTAATIPSSFFTVVDQQLVNDEVGQSDLTQMGRDDTDALTYRLFWSWDSTDMWTGTGQTGDACALFDTDGDGNVNYAVCARIENPGANPLVVEMTSDSPMLFECTDAANDRCTQPTPRIPVGVQAGTLGSGGIDSDGTLITDTDPFSPDGSNDPNDSTLQVNIPKNLVGGGVLVNVCSYPSAGNGGNNNPFDCIVTPGAGFLVIVKDAGDDTATDFVFDVDPVPQGVPSTYTQTGSGTVPTIGVLAGGTETVTETVPSGWSLQSASCVLDDGMPTGTFDSDNDEVTGIAIQSGLETTCTFTNVPEPVTLTVIKHVVNDNGGTKTAADFTMSVTDGNPSPASFAGAESPGTTVGIAPNTAYAVTESDVSGYTQTGATPGCSSETGIPIGGNATCIITNDDQAASLIVKKVVTNDNGGTLAADDFSFVVNGESPIGFEADGQNDLTVAAGSYSITEPAVSGYTTTYENCSDLVIPNGGSATCTITNDDIAPTLTLTKVIVGGDGTAAESFDVADNGTTKIDDAVNPSTSVGPYPTTPGAHTITETLGDGSAVSSDWIADYRGDCNANGEVTLAIGETKSCTITNSRRPEIKVVKDLVPSNDPGLFDLKIDETTYTNGGAGYGDGGTTGFVYVATGSHTVAELGHGATSLADYVSNVQCDSGKGSTDLGTSHQFSVGYGDQVTCTITNLKPGISLTKDATETSFDAVDDVIHYTLVATNTGNVTLTDVSISDPKLGALSCTPAQPAMLAPGATLSCTGTHTVTQADLDAGSYANVGSTSGQPPSGPPVTDSDDETVPAVQLPALSLAKSATPPTYKAVSEAINYSYLVTNTGNVRLAGPVSVADDKATVACPAVNTVGNNDTFLDPTESVTCTASYTITQADLNAGSVTNVATATAGGTDSNQDEATVTASQSPAISLTKLAEEESFDAVGDVLHYTLVATNTGNVTLTAVTISDPKLGTLACTPQQPTALAPGEKLTCTGTHTVDQGDLNAGSYANTGSTKGTPPTGPDLTATADETVPAVQRPALLLAKTATPATYKAVGEIISYSYVVTNTGNVRLAGPVIVADDKATVTCPAVDTVGNNDAYLDPTESVTCVASYTVTQADLNNGSVTNTAIATAGETDSNQDEATVEAIRSPALHLVKHASPATYKAVGETIAYSYLVTNTGNVRLAGPVTVADNKATVTCPAVDTIGNKDAFLDPGEALQCAASYTVTQADLNAGSVTNTAVATADKVNSNEDQETVTATPPPPPKVDLSITKTGPAAPVIVGANFKYTLTVRNAGPDTATNVTVDDPLPAGTRFVSVTSTQGSCTGGEVIRCSLGLIARDGQAVITVTVKAMRTGTQVNEATVTGPETDTDLTNNRAREETLVRSVLKPPEVCPVMTVRPRSLAVGHKSYIRVALKGSSVARVRILVKGAGIRKVGVTNRYGRARIAVRPKRAGVITIRMVNKPKRCATRRIGAVGVFQPPIFTG